MKDTPWWNGLSLSLSLLPVVAPTLHVYMSRISFNVELNAHVEFDPAKSALIVPISASLRVHKLLLSDLVDEVRSAQSTVDIVKIRPISLNISLRK